MALIKCPVCEKDVSENAVFCPNCGEPIKNKSQEKQKIPKEERYMMKLSHRLKYNYLLKRMRQTERHLSIGQAVLYNDSKRS